MDSEKEHVYNKKIKQSYQFNGSFYLKRFWSGTRKHIFCLDFHCIEIMKIRSKLWRKYLILSFPKRSLSICVVHAWSRSQIMFLLFSLRWETYFVFLFLFVLFFGLLLLLIVASDHSVSVRFSTHFDSTDWNKRTIYTFFLWTSKISL